MDVCISLTTEIGAREDSGARWMRKGKAVLTMLFVIGLVLLFIGVNDFLKAVRRGLCEACGMEVEVD